MEHKQLAPHPPSGTHHRGRRASVLTKTRVPKLEYAGYSAPGVEKVSQHVYDADDLAKQRVQAPDVKESFEVGREESDSMPNIWLPDGILPGFKEASLDFFWVGASLRQYLDSNLSGVVCRHAMKCNLKFSVLWLSAFILKKNISQRTTQFRKINCVSYITLGTYLPPPITVTTRLNGSIWIASQLKH